MPGIKYFYVDSGGDVHRNDDVLPSDVLARHGPVFRFAYDDDSKRIFIQDQSFRKGLASGDQKAWHFANEALRFLRGEYGTTMLDREYGDPKGSSITRDLSDYPDAWAGLSDYLGEEFGAKPIDIKVCEHVPARNASKSPAIAWIGPGTAFAAGGIDGPCIAIERGAGADPESGDVSMAALSRMLAAFYLDNLGQIMGHVLPSEQHGRFESIWDAYSASLDSRLMFAVRDGHDTKIFKAGRQRDGSPHDEASVRRMGLADRDHVVFFSFSAKEKMVVLRNYLPSDASRNPVLGSIVDDVLKYAAKASGASKDEMALAFKPAMMAPFVSRLSRYGSLWEMLGNEPRDMHVVELPISVRGGAAVVSSSSEENSAAPAASDYMLAMGISAKYPVMLVDSRARSRGGKARAMLEAYGSFVGMPVGEKTSDQVDEEARFLLDMGFSRSDVVDFLSPRDKLSQRMEARRRVRRLSREMLAKKASIGPAIDMNAWRHVGLQETLNRAQHEREHAVVAPLNEPDGDDKDERKTKTYEELLDKDRDKNLGYMKTIEQLLRESRS